MKIAEKKEIETFLAQYPDTTMLEVLLPDINGILRCKRIPAIELSFFKSGSRACVYCLGGVVVSIPMSWMRKCRW